MKLSPNYFSKRQSLAIFLLVLTVVALELLFVRWPFALPFFHQSDKFLEAQIEKEYQVLQSQSLKTKSSYSGLFNPNFIGFYKGYTLGISVQEIERLQRFRASNQWINSESDFQKVSGISDSLINEIAPYFKFPKWVGESRQKNTGSSESISKLDLNTDQWKHSDRSMALVLCCPKESCTIKRDLRAGSPTWSNYGLNMACRQRLLTELNINLPLKRLD